MKGDQSRDSLSDKGASGRAKGAPILKSDPEHCPGTYDMHFYCKYDNPDHGFMEFPWHSHHCQTRGEALGQARQAGWIFHRDRTATCPTCAKALRKQP